MLKKTMSIIISLKLLEKIAGLLLKFTIGADDSFPELLLILSGVWMIAALLLLTFERGEKRLTAHLAVFLGFDLVATAISLGYAGWFHVFEVEWYHYFIMGTLFSLLVDAVLILAALRHMRYKKYIKISEETIKNA